MTDKLKQQLEAMTKERDWYRRATETLSRREGNLIKENEQLRTELFINQGKLNE